MLNNRYIVKRDFSLGKHYLKKDDVLTENSNNIIDSNGNFICEVGNSVVEKYLKPLRSECCANCKFYAELAKMEHDFNVSHCCLMFVKTENKHRVLEVTPNYFCEDFAQLN